MTLEQAALVAEVVSGLAVVGSLIYVAYEIRQQSRLNRLTAANALAAQWSGLMESLHNNPEMAKIWLKGMLDFDDLDAVSKLRFGAYFGRFLRNSEGLYLHLQDKSLDPMVWRGIERAIRDIISLPGSQQWWETRKHWYTDNFQLLVARLSHDEHVVKVFDKYGVEKLLS